MSMRYFQVMFLLVRLKSRLVSVDLEPPVARMSLMYLSVTRAFIPCMCERNSVGAFPESTTSVSTENTRSLSLIVRQNVLYEVCT